ncbi:MAG: glycosyltransferase family 2 protein [Proteobacteria bacterium]|nr:glycosyltransferase family 2 protein [Pseudomonadota bacterium]
MTRAVSSNQTKTSLSVIVPVYNEEALINDAVEHLVKTASQWVDDLEIILVNDGSKDSSPAIIDQLAEKHDMVRALHQSPNKGFGATVRKGYEAATKELVTYCPADHHFTAEEFDAFLVLIKYADVVIGYRRHRRIELPFFNWMVSSGYHALISILYRLNFYDVNWIHLYHRNQIDSFLGKSDGVFLLAETLINANKKGLRVVGVDVQYVERQAGTPTGVQPKTIFKTLKEVFDFYFHQGRQS